jgi:hypothetical protein
MIEHFSSKSFGVSTISALQINVSMGENAFMQTSFLPDIGEKN